MRPRTQSLFRCAAWGVALWLFAGIAALLLLRTLTTRALRDVRQAGRAVDIVAQARDLHAPVMRLLAYAQLVYQGDGTFQEALTQQLDLVDEAFGRLEQQVGVMAAAQWSLFKQAQADWIETRQALQGLAATSRLTMEQRLSLRETLRSRSASLQRTLESLERESQAQRRTLAAAADRGSRQTDSVAGVLVALWLLGSAALWIWARYRVLWPLAQLAAGAEALTRGELSFRMQPSPGTDAEPLVTSFNAMAESLQRSQEQLSQHAPL